MQYWFEILILAAVSLGAGMLVIKLIRARKVKTGDSSACSQNNDRKECATQGCLPDDDTAIWKREMQESARLTRETFDELLRLRPPDWTPEQGKGG